MILAFDNPRQIVWLDIHHLGRWKNHESSSSMFPASSARRMLLASSVAPAVLPSSSNRNHSGRFPNDASQIFQPAIGVSGMSDDDSDVPSTYNLSFSFRPSTAVIIAGLLSAFFLLFVLSVFMKKCGTGNSTDGDPSREDAVARGRGVDRAVVENLPLVRFSSLRGSNRFFTGASNEGKGTTECVVCLSEFQENEILRLLPTCEHSFHQECIDMWLSTHRTCPLCRSNVLPEKVISTRETPIPTSGAAAGEPARPSAGETAMEAIGTVSTSNAVDFDGATATQATEED